MADQDRIRAFYVDNPRMVSSPFGGVEGINAELLSGVLDKLGFDLTGKRVLDVGCGRGHAGEVVRSRGGGYVGADFVRSGGGFPLALADAAALPFADESFDLLFCIDASEHFPRPEAAAAEFHRVLRSGGGFFLSAPNYGNVAGLVKKVWEGLGWYAKDTWAPFGRWLPQECEQALTARRVRRLYGQAGFSVDHVLGHGAEVGLGLCPWVDHPRTPESIQFRLQRLFAALGPATVRVWPGASLHLFWRMTKC